MLLSIDTIDKGGKDDDTLCKLVEFVSRLHFCATKTPWLTYLETDSRTAGLFVCLQRIEFYRNDGKQTLGCITEEHRNKKSPPFGGAK